MSNIRQQIEFLEAIEKATAEREAAYETRDTDRERWNAAKQAYAEQRSFWRSIYAEQQSKEEVNPEDVAVAPGTVVRESKTFSPQGSNEEGN